MKNDMNRASPGPAVSLLGVIVALGLLTLAAVPSSGAPPPAGRTYFTILLGMEAPYSSDADCVRFTKTEMCYSDGTCGPWIPVESGRQESSFAFEMEYYEEGIAVRIEGQARIENRGKKDSLGAAGRVRAEGAIFNFALTGRSASRRKCARLLREWDPVSDGISPE